MVCWPRPCEKRLPLRASGRRYRHHHPTNRFRMSTFYSRRERDNTIGHTRVVGLVALLGVAVALGLAVMPRAGGVRPGRPGIAAAPPPALDRFILNALLVPALGADAMPLRWTDPRPISQCGPKTAVRGNG